MSSTMPPILAVRIGLLVFLSTGTSGLSVETLLCILPFTMNEIPAYSIDGVVYEHVQLLSPQSLVINANRLLMQPDVEFT